nr:metallophosphoesterase [Candidatus Bathyarchaeota archaeon]
MDEVTIVQISDIHVMTPHFSKELEVNVVEEVNSLSPDLLVVTGDLTDDGLYYQYEEALSLLEKFDVKR